MEKVVAQAAAMVRTEHYNLYSQYQSHSHCMQNLVRRHHKHHRSPIHFHCTRRCIRAVGTEEGEGLMVAPVAMGASLEAEAAVVVPQGKEEARVASPQPHK